MELPAPIRPPQEFWWQAAILPTIMNSIAWWPIFGMQRGLCFRGRQIVTDPKGRKPDSDHPHEEDLPLELNLDEDALTPLDDQQHSRSPAMNASTEEFTFPGPVEELDFTEPADFTFPTELAAEGQPDFAGAEGLFGGDETGAAPAETVEEVAAAPGVVTETVAELESDEEEKPKRRFELPAWFRTAEWLIVGGLAAVALLSLIISVFVIDKSPKQVTLVLNIACPLMLALIPYTLWRSSKRWSVPATSATYTVMLAISTAALIAGTWFEGLELVRYEWQFSKTRVRAGKPPLPPPVVIPEPEPVADKTTGPAKGGEAPPPVKAPADVPAPPAKAPADAAGAPPVKAPADAVVPLAAPKDVPSPAGK
jgi:hypothetical protein